MTTPDEVTTPKKTAETAETLIRPNGAALPGQPKSGDETIVRIPLDKLSPSPTNPRKKFEGLDELAASIKERGVIEPAVVRPLAPGRFEIVCGERRYRASRLAKLPDLKCVIREHTDAEVREIQLIENVQRENMSELEEADGYKALQKIGKTAEAIAQASGKGKSYIHARLKLAELGPDGRKAFEAGKLGKEILLYVARLPAALQGEAVKEITSKRYAYSMTDGDGPAQHISISAREAARVIQSKYMLKLAEAPFDTKDAKLCPKAGACGPCPKRTGNQREIFADIGKSAGGADVCTDPTCYREKARAEWSTRTSKALGEGATVLTPKLAKGIFHEYGLKGDSDYTDLARQNYDDPKHRSYRELLTKAPLGSFVYAWNETEEKGYELMKDAEVRLHLKALHPSLARGGGPTAPDRAKSREQNKKDKAARAVEARTEAILCEQVGELAFEKIPRAAWAVLAERALDGVEDPSLVLRRYGLADEKGEVKDFRKRLDALKEPAARGLFIELSLLSSLGAERTELIRAYKLDPKAIEARAKRELKEEAERVEKAKAAAKAAAKKPPAAKAKPLAKTKGKK